MWNDPREKLPGYGVPVIVANEFVRGYAYWDGSTWRSEDGEPCLIIVTMWQYQ